MKDFMKNRQQYMIAVGATLLFSLLLLRYAMPFATVSSGNAGFAVPSSEQEITQSLADNQLALATYSRSRAISFANGTLSCLFFDPDSFPRSVSAAKPYVIDGPLLAGVVPHHLVADRLIASFFLTASQWADAYDTVVLVGPNHSGDGSKIITSTYDFSTPFGNLPCNLNLTQRLLSLPNLPITDNPHLLENDHALATLAPYVKYYLPQVKVTSLLLTRDVGAEEILHIASILAETERCLVAGSIDFSHYLSPEEAAVKDSETWEAIQTSDFTCIARMGDDHLDSPGTLRIILNLVSMKNGPGIEMLDHSEASQLWNAPLDEGTTTYFILGATAP